MRSFIDRYLSQARKKRSVLCVGLDPTPEHVPPTFGHGENMTILKRYLEEVIEIAAFKVPIVKPQFAYYGAAGVEGFRLLQDIVAYAKHLGLLVILDHKISDIGETVAQYGVEVFEQIGADALTGVPYLGSAIIKPLMPWLAKGCCVISMVRTSNPEAAELQDQRMAGGMLVYQQVALMVRQWNDDVRAQTDGIGSIGAVIGATWPEQAITCRQLLGDDVFALIPGYGAQGGGAQGAVQAVTTSDGRICGTINSSRGITLQSWFDTKKGEPKPGDPLELVATAIDAANAELNAALAEKIGNDPYSDMRS